MKDIYETLGGWLGADFPACVLRPSSRAFGCARLCLQCSSAYGKLPVGGSVALARKSKEEVDDFS